MPERLWPVTRILWSQLSAVVTSTDFLGDKCRAQGLRTRVIRNGIVRKLFRGQQIIKSDRPHRVLFWRDPSRENGADVCLEVFRALASRYPNISFDCAVRPHWDPVAGLEDLAEQNKNVHIFRFPYQCGITIEKLLSESICVLMPFRRLSTQPQLAILESMMSGTVVITSAIGSNHELIDSGQNGFLIPPGDVTGNLRAVECMIDDVVAAMAMGELASQSVRQKWNWDSYLSDLIGVYEEVLSEL